MTFLADIKAIPRAYANILFVEHTYVGLLFILATFLFPNIGIAGMLGAISGYVTSQWATYLQ